MDFFKKGHQSVLMYTTHLCGHKLKMNGYENYVKYYCHKSASCF